MRYEDFVWKVQEKGQFPAPADASAGVEAVLETLGERLTRKWRHHLAAQLPEVLKECVLRRSGAEVFDAEEFCNRVGARSNVHRKGAQRSAKAVAAVLWESIAADELESVLGSLPEEFRALLSRPTPDRSTKT